MRIFVGVLVLVAATSARAEPTVAEAMQARCPAGLTIAFADKPASVEGDFNADGKKDQAAVVDAPASVKPTMTDTFGYGADDEAGTHRMIMVLWGGATDCVLLGGRNNGLFSSAEPGSDGKDLLSVARAKTKKKPDVLLVPIQTGDEARLVPKGKKWKWIEPQGGD